MMGRSRRKKIEVRKPRNRTVPPRFTADRDDRERFLKILGAILISTMVVGFFCSVWFGWMIRTGLTALDHEGISNTELRNNNRVLENRRSTLLQKDMIEKKASVLGLTDPAPKQIIRP